MEVKTLFFLENTMILGKNWESGDLFFLVTTLLHILKLLRLPFFGTLNIGPPLLFLHRAPLFLRPSLVGIISKIRHYLSETALLKIYYAQIHSHLLYGLIIWGSTFSTYLKKLITLQNKAIKFICAAKFCDSSSAYYKRLKILKLTDLYKLVLNLFMPILKKCFPKICLIILF